MRDNEAERRIARQVHEFVLEGFSPRLSEPKEAFEGNPAWGKLTALGTQLWLDTGSIADAEATWSREFAALTTNNTLLNREVQEGAYDELIPRADELLSRVGEMDGRRRRLEIAFILNARHGLRLVERFDAKVSVEEHTDLAGDVDAAVAYARRYHAICPERFIVKIPFTPAGLLATRKVSAEGIPVNHTLGFSARQNYVIARLARPSYVNVFLGRLNSFTADNDLGDGAYVGERATLSSQAVLRQLHREHDVATKQIAASFRTGRQVRDLAGVDVMTIPPKIAREFLEIPIPPEDLACRTSAEYKPAFRKGVDAQAIRCDTLWDVEDPLVACIDALILEDVDSFTPDDLVSFFAEHGCGDVLPRWTDEQTATSAAEGKIPRLEDWADALKDKAIGLDSLLNLAGLNAFRADQKAMDDRVADVLNRRR